MNIYLIYWDHDIDEYNNEEVKSKIKKNEDESNSKGYFILETNGWNDYGYETLFQLYYKDLTTKTQYEVGKVKIAHEDMNDFKSGCTKTKLKLKQTFKKLDKKFISFGQSPRYYINLISLHKLGIINLKTFLSNMRDILLLDDSELLSFQTIKDLSLVRSNQAINIYNHKDDLCSVFLEEKIINIGKLNKLFKSDHDYSFEVSDSNKTIYFDFNNKTFLPHRINVIVGKNASGKTYLFNKIIEEYLRGKKNTEYNGDEYNSNNDNTIEFNKFRFPSLLALSYSAFDDKYLKYLILDENKNINRKYLTINETFGNNGYFYCGLHKYVESRDVNNEKDVNIGIMSPEKYYNNFKSSQKEINRLQRNDLLKEVLLKLLLDEDKVERIISNSINFNEELSSGEKIIILSFSKLIENIEYNTLILFDEPETHLHPNAISSIMIILNTILEYFDAYCIIATHSPIIIQEIPSKYLKILHRSDSGLPIVEIPDKEFFGSNITEIIDEVFQLNIEESNYKTILNNLFKSKSNIDELEREFKKPISINLKTYLKVLELFGSEKNDL